jgi:hypothetical protein
MVGIGWGCSRSKESSAEDRARVPLDRDPEVVHDPLTGMVLSQKLKMRVISDLSMLMVRIVLCGWLPVEQRHVSERLEEGGSVVPLEAEVASAVDEAREVKLVVGARQVPRLAKVASRASAHRGQVGHELKGEDIGADRQGSSSNVSWSSLLRTYHSSQPLSWSTSFDQQLICEGLIMRWQLSKQILRSRQVTLDRQRAWSSLTETNTSGHSLQGRQGGDPREMLGLAC